jgi:pimeloyl-ACP methyl ester carboxylesterase
VRGHGESGGLFTWGRQEPEDVAEVAAALRREYARVGGLGFSFGGYHAAVAAALHRPFDAVALVAAPHRLFLLDHNLLGRGFWRSVPLMVRRQRRLPRFSPFHLPRRDTPGRLVHRIAPVPLLVVHGSADWLVPPRHAQVLFARAGEPKSLVLVDGGLHAENMLVDDPEPLLAPLADFFGRTLGGGGAGAQRG